MVSASRSKVSSSVHRSSPARKATSQAERVTVSLTVVTSTDFTAAASSG